MTTINAVGFDLDGTLFDHRGSAEDAVDGFCRSLGVAPSPQTRESWFRAEEEQFERWRCGEIGFQEQRRRRLQQVLPQWGIMGPSAADDADEIFESYLRRYRASWRLFPDVVSTLEDLRGRGYRLGILTNGSSEQQADKVDSLGLRGLVDGVCVSEDSGYQKPDERAFLALAATLGTAPEQCLFIGDNPVQDIAGAREAGMTAMLIDRYGGNAAGLAPALAFLDDRVPEP